MSTVDWWSTPFSEMWREVVVEFAVSRLLSFRISRSASVSTVVATVELLLASSGSNVSDPTDAVFGM